MFDPFCIVTTTGANEPEGATCVGTYGSTPKDQLASSASTFSWYWAMVCPLGITSWPRSKKPSSAGSLEPHRS